MGPCRETHVCSVETAEKKEQTTTRLHNRNVIVPHKTKRIYVTDQHVLKCDIKQKLCQAVAGYTLVG